MCHSFTLLCKRCENTRRTVLMIYFYDICLFVLHVGHLMAEPHSYSYMYLMLFLSKFV